MTNDKNNGALRWDLLSTEEIANLVSVASKRVQSDDIETLCMIREGREVLLKRAHKD